MLAQYERVGILSNHSKDAAIPNLGLVMALFIDFARGARSCSLLKSAKKVSLGPMKDKKKWQPHHFDSHIVAYARKYDIPLVGPRGIDETVAKAEADVELPTPESNNDSKADPFGFVKTLKKYKDERGGITSFLAGKPSVSPIGGDNLDITSWTSAKRKSKAFDKQDPLSKEHIAALKKGEILSLV
jgi:hypothetical protein